MNRKRRNWTGRCKCSGCFYKWTGVVSLGKGDEGFPSRPLQCPECKQMTGLADPEGDDDQDTADQD